MKNAEIADIFKRIGALLEIQDDDFFKIRAYYKAADNILALEEDIAVLSKEERLASIPGVGKALREKIKEYLNTGEMAAYQKLIEKIPESILDVVKVPSVGPKKAKLFYEELGVKTITDLNKALEQGKLNNLPGIKKKTIENIQQGLEFIQSK